MSNCRFLLFLLLLLPFSACVGKKIYRAEVKMRNASESRETVLLRELNDRKKETANLTKAVGELNRSLGALENQLKQIETEASSRNVQFGETSGKLSIEKARLEQQLAKLGDSLERREALLRKVMLVQNLRRETLLNLFQPLYESYSAWVPAGLTLEVTDETLWLTLPDRSLFEPNGLGIGGAGIQILAPLANFLSSRPDIDVEINAHTDNTLPKDKSIKDTWEWSLQRATALARTLVREFNVNADQLTPVGKGEFFPMDSNETPDGRATNRRTVFVIRPVLPAVPLAE